MQHDNEIIYIYTYYTHRYIYMLYTNHRWNDDHKMHPCLLTDDLCQLPIAAHARIMHGRYKYLNAQAANSHNALSRTADDEDAQQVMDMRSSNGAIITDAANE